MNADNSISQSVDERERSLTRELHLPYSEAKSSIPWIRTAQQTALESQLSTENNHIQKTKVQSSSESIDHERDIVKTNLENINSENEPTDQLSSKFPSSQYLSQQAGDVEPTFSIRVSKFLDSIKRIIKARRDRGALGNVKDQKTEKKRQKNNLIVLCIFIFGSVALFVFFGQNVNVVKEPEVRVYRNDFTLAPRTLEKQSFQRQYSDKLDVLTNKIKELEKQIKQQKEKQKLNSQEVINSKKYSSENGLRDFPIAAMPDDSMAIALKNSHHLSKSRLGAVKVASIETPKQVLPVARLPVRSRAWDTPIARNRARNEAEKTYIPAGSFARATVLSGVTAPAGGNATQDPIPMLLEISDVARLPNQFRSQIRHCFVTANASGDISSERVWIRLDRLSCISKNGQAIDVRVQGYVTGDDGKTGVKARLVTRAGQAVANALFMGTLSGVGKAVSLSAQSTTTFGSGTSTQNVDNAWKAGIGEGASNAMDRIVNYYLKLADKMFPVLEIDSGRQVDIVLSQGVTVADQEKKSYEPEERINSSEEFGRQVRGRE